MLSDTQGSLHRIRCHTDQSDTWGHTLLFSSVISVKHHCEVDRWSRFGASLAQYDSFAIKTPLVRYASLVRHILLPDPEGPAVLRTNTKGQTRPSHMMSGGGICVSLWLHKQEKERGQTNRGKWLMVSQIALSGGEKKILRMKRAHLWLFYFKGKWVGDKSCNATRIFHNANDLVCIAAASWFHLETKFN